MITFSMVTKATITLSMWLQKKYNSTVTGESMKI